MVSTRTWLAVIACMTLAAPAIAQGGRGVGPRAPVRDRQQPDTRTGTASLDGRVVSPEGAPIRRAQVQLTAADAGPSRTTTTDIDGRYSFTELPAGRYQVRANKGGFVSFAYGQREMNAGVPPIIVGDGETLSGLTIVLPRGSAITGRVTDEFGDPVLQAQVQVLRFQYQPDGQRTLVPAGMQAMTDDLGQFRLYGLTPGDYVVSASARNQFVAGAARVQQDAPEEGYAPTYYPGTGNPAQAQPVTVGLGQDVSVAIQLVPSRLSRIAGVVFDSQGRPAPQGTAVTIRPAANIGPIGFRGGSVNSADGSFAIPAVPPGDYVLEVRPRPRPGARGDSGSEPEFASVPIAVAGADITGIHIVTGRGATLSGRVVFEGTPPAPGTRVRVVPQPADSTRAVPFAPRGAQSDGLADADGTFRVDGVAGPIFLRITLEGAGAETQRYMTKSVFVDGVDVADIPFDPARRGVVNGITVVVTDQLTTVTGTVTDGTATTTESATVLIVPEPLPSGVSPTRYVRVLRTSADGSFSVRGLPTGRYAAVAVNRFEQTHQYDPEVIGRVRQVGKSFSLREGESVALDLRLASDF